LLVSFLTLSLLSLNNPEMRIGEMSQDFCQTEEVLKKIGTLGACRMVIAPKKIDRQGECTGIFAGSLPCIISFASDKSGSGLNIKCGTDMNNPSVDQNMEAEVSSFNVAAVFTLENGKTSILKDKSLYTTISNQMIEITISEFENKSEGIIFIYSQSEKQAFTNVSCR
jgi:hypothetical protein